MGGSVSYIILYTGNVILFQSMEYHGMHNDHYFMADI